MVGGTILSTDNGVQINFKGCQIANALTIDLNVKDLYDMTFYRIRGANFKQVSKTTDVYFDMLTDIFKTETGLEVSL